MPKVPVLFSRRQLPYYERSAWLKMLREHEDKRSSGASSTDAVAQPDAPEPT